MGKYFCNRCYGLTFSLRYMTTNGNWEKPRGLPQYCKNCNLIEPQRTCVTLNKVKKMRGGD